METTENKTQIKKRILTQCMLKQQSLIDDFKSRLKELKLLQDAETEEISSGNRRAFSQSEYNSIYQALDFAEAEMGILVFLNSKDNSLHETADLGAVIVTNRATFFISVSIEQFSADGHPFVGISTQSPLFLAMRGKRIGDYFTYEGTSYYIEDIF